MNLSGFKKICREIFGDSRGVISWGHVASTVALFAAIGWVSYILFKDPGHHLPALDGITGFVVAPYSANKLASAAQSFSQNPIPIIQPDHLKKD